MRDTMNEITQFSPYAGGLFLETVPGDTTRREAENEADAAVGRERDMYVYAPVSGCHGPKQNQVLMVLRDSDTEASAREVMERYDLRALAEEKHFLLLFPNPQPGGWNYTVDGAREDDISYLIRCFAALRGSKVGVNGFNGMTFYIGATANASAMLMTMAARKPINVPAMMIAQFPDGYQIPSDALGIPTAAWISGNPTAADYWKKTNDVAVGTAVTEQGVTCYRSRQNENIRLMVTDQPIERETVALAWETLFSETRRWQNDTHGTYQGRTDFTARGFVPHVQDSSLGVNNGFPHTWYEYVPPKLRGTTQKVPLLINFHGGSCIPLYAAEQSGWHDIADEEGFIVVYPKADYKAMWNVWGDPSIPINDEAFFLALVEHMKKAYPIDERRIYISGFSMGGMMSNAMACAHPELVAAAAPCNAYNEGYLSSYAAMERRRTAPVSPTGGVIDLCKPFDAPEDPPTSIKVEADAKKAAFDYRVPVFQISGLLDQTWPIRTTPDQRLKTFDYWKAYNNIPVEPFVTNEACESGLTADETFYDCEDQRFLHHRWFSRDEGHPALYEVLLAKRMPHALDLRAPRLAWQFMKKFARNADGTLSIEE